MGKSILTSKQLDFLELAQAQKFIAKKFYLTGDTALSEFYLKHRLSDDIDLFTKKEEINQEVVEAFLKKISADLSVKEIKDLPTMLVPFNRKDMEKFFLDLAKSLEGQIFK